jgi:hypothetical protein
MQNLPSKVEGLREALEVTKDEEEEKRLRQDLDDTQANLTRLQEQRER